MQQNIWRLVAFVATLALVAMVSGVAETGSRRGQAGARSGARQGGATTTANKNQPKPKMTIKVSPEYTSSLLKKVFEVSPMGNIDSRPVCATHERFATIRLWIRILRIARRISSFSANC